MQPVFTTEEVTEMLNDATASVVNSNVPDELRATAFDAAIRLLSMRAVTAVGGAVDLSRLPRS